MDWSSPWPYFAAFCVWQIWRWVLAFGKELDTQTQLLREIRAELERQRVHGNDSVD